MINDISGGELDERMFDTVAQLRVPYIMMHMRGTPQTMQQQTDYEDVTAGLLKYFPKAGASVPFRSERCYSGSGIWF